MSDKQFYTAVARIYGTIFVVLAVLAASIGSYQSHSYTMSTESYEYRYEEVIEIATEDVDWIPTEVPLIRTLAYVNLTFEEMDLLQQIAMEEARGEDAIGQALVMLVVLNRSRLYHMSIREIIYAPGQFSTYGIGTYTPNEANNQAISMILDGWDESEGALYFSADGYNGKVPLFQHGGHYFSK